MNKFNWRGLLLASASAMAVSMASNADDKSGWALARIAAQGVIAAAAFNARPRQRKTERRPA